MADAPKYEDPKFQEFIDSVISAEAKPVPESRDSKSIASSESSASAIEDRLGSSLVVAAWYLTGAVGLILLGISGEQRSGVATILIACLAAFWFLVLLTRKNRARRTDSERLKASPLLTFAAEQRRDAVTMPVQISGGLPDMQENRTRQPTFSLMQKVLLFAVAVTCALAFAAYYFVDARHWIIILAVFIAFIAYDWLKTLHYNNERWKFGRSNDGWFRAILVKRRTPTDPHFIDFGKKDGKRIIRWGRFIEDRYSGDYEENKVEVEIPWSLFYPDLETLRRLVFYPWVEEKIALWEFDISTRWMLWHGHWLYDSPDGMTCGEAFYLTFPELIEEIRPKLKVIASRKRLPAGWTKH